MSKINKEDLSKIIIETVYEMLQNEDENLISLMRASENLNGELDNNWSVHQLYTTCDYAPKSTIFSWLVGGLNYQVEHHLFPNISHIHYRHISKIVQSKTKKYGLPYHVNKSFPHAVWQHIKMLKLLGEGQNTVGRYFSPLKVTR